MTYYDNAVPKITDVITVANNGKTSLANKALTLTSLQVMTAPDANGMQGTITLNWDSGVNAWAVNIG